MIFDVKLMFTQDDVDTPDMDIVAAGVVGDILDLNDSGLSLEDGEIAFIGIVVTEALAGASTCVFTVESCATVGGSYTTVVASKAYTAAELIIGKEIKIPIPEGCNQFVRLSTTATSVSAGMVTAGIVK